MNIGLAIHWKMCTCTKQFRCFILMTYCCDTKSTNNNNAEWMMSDEIYKKKKAMNLHWTTCKTTVADCIFSLTNLHQDEEFLKTNLIKLDEREKKKWEVRRNLVNLFKKKKDAVKFNYSRVMFMLRTPILKSNDGRNRKIFYYLPNWYNNLYF